MNTVAATLLLLWLTGWTLAMVRAGLKARINENPTRGRQGVAGSRAHR